MEISNIEEKLDQLIQILQTQKKGDESKMIMLLAEQIRETNKNYITILQELQDIKAQLNPDYRQNALLVPQKFQNEDVIVDQFTSFEKNIRNQFQQFQGMAQNLYDKANIVVQKFKEAGIKSLNNVCEFLNVKETLVELRDIAQSNAVKMENRIEKIEAIGNEVGEAANHLKNIGNLVSDKPDVKSAPQGSLNFFSKLKNHYQHNLDKFSNRVDKLNNAIEKLNVLEHKANHTLAQGNKASVKEKLENNKALIETKQSSEPKQIREKSQMEVAL